MILKYNIFCVSFVYYITISLFIVFCQKITYDDNFIILLILIFFIESTLSCHLAAKL